MTMDHLWGEWTDPQTACVRAIRFSHCGTWIEKKFAHADEAVGALKNQQTYGVLKAMRGTTPYSYISEAVQTITQEMQDLLHEVLCIGDVDELPSCFENSDESAKKVGQEWGDSPCGNRTKAQLIDEAYRIWEACEMSGLDDLSFGDNHWGNVGFHNGALVCIDFDPEFYETYA